MAFKGPVRFASNEDQHMAHLNVCHSSNRLTHQIFALGFGIHAWGEAAQASLASHALRPMKLGVRFVGEPRRQNDSRQCGRLVSEGAASDPLSPLHGLQARRTGYPRASGQEHTGLPRLSVPTEVWPNEGPRWYRASIVPLRIKINEETLPPSTRTLRRTPTQTHGVGRDVRTARCCVHRLLFCSTAPRHQ